MGLVLAAFYWLNKPSEAEVAEYQRQMDSIAAVEQQQQRRDVSAGDVDTLSAGEVAQLMSVLENMPADNAVINNEGVVLALRDGQVQGTVTVGLCNCKRWKRSPRQCCSFSNKNS